ncbi:AP-4-A phosphorylase [Poriferisphaera corsica]|uniref:AP-4-A phosphorylase n=2 Tax=Poriferisphaera corsica TaxID=2528020 RepID=A0A517YU72_9BACT|nr:AP-4-A phosphorylase [Poriferisphaera corsica]
MNEKNLWAPWRISYIQSLESEGDQTSRQNTEGPKPNRCFLCEASEIDDTGGLPKDQLVLHHSHSCLIMLNRFPYSNGHLLIAPFDHVADIDDLNIEQRSDLFEMTNIANKAVRIAMNPQGVNIGINLGRCAGAGVPGHVHVHVVPRWEGDVNFMQVVGDVRVIPQSLEESCKVLKAAIDQVLQK